MEAHGTTRRRPEAGEPVRSAGFTLLEVGISLTVLCILFASAFSITFETFAFVGDNEAVAGAQGEASQAIDRMTEILRKTGWCTVAGVTYPRVLSGGSELEFLVLRDLDGNGYPFSATTGEVEYGPVRYRIRADASGNLRVFNGAAAVWHLCRNVRAITFETYLQDPTLQMKEIRVSIEARKLTRRGEAIDRVLVGNINMRN